MGTDDPVFAFSVEQELDKAAALLARGLAAQRAPHYTDTARFLVMVDLAAGLRQLLAVARSLLTRPATMPPTGPTAPIAELLAGVLAVFPVQVWRTDEGERIYGFLRGDALLQDAIEVLDGFERHRAGPVLVWPGEERRPRTPEAAWRQLEHAVAERLFPDAEERQQRQRSPDPAAFQQPVSDEIAQTVKRCVDDVFTVLARTSSLKGVQAWPSRWRQLLGHGRT